MATIPPTATLQKHQTDLATVTESVADLEILERGVQPLSHETHPKNLGLPRPLPNVEAFMTRVIIVATDWSS